MPKVSNLSELMELGMRNMVWCNPDALDQAIKYFDQALAQEPDNLEALYYKGVVYRSKHEPESAIKIADKILSIMPGSIVGLNLKAGAYRNLDREDEAVEIYNSIIKIKNEIPENFLNLYALASTYSNLSHYSTATDYYLAALKYNKNNLLCIEYLAYSYIDEKKYAEAIPLLEQLKHFWKEDHHLFKSLGECHEKLGKFEEAIEYYNQSLAIVGEEDFNSYGALANCYHNIGKYEKAEEYYNLYFDKEENLQDVYLITKCAFLFIDISQREKDNGNSEEEILKLKATALSLLESAYKRYHTDPSYKTSINKNDKDIIKQGFALRMDLESELEKYKDSKTAAIEDVSYFIEKNPLKRAEKQKLDEILTDTKLKNYYHSFKQLLHIVLISSFNRESGEFQTAKPGLIAPAAEVLKSALTVLPGASFIIDITQKVIEAGIELRDDNRARNFLSNMKDFDEGEKIAKQVAIEVTLSKKLEIQNVTSNKGKFLSAIQNFKDEIIVSLVKEPEKALAYKDAGIMIALCKKGPIEADSTSTLITRMVRLIMDSEKQFDRIPAILANDSTVIQGISDSSAQPIAPEQNDSSTKKEEKCCIVMAIPETHCDNWFLEQPKLLEGAYKAGNMGLVLSLIAAFQPIAISGEDYPLYGEGI